MKSELVHCDAYAAIVKLKPRHMPLNPQAVCVFDWCLTNFLLHVYLKYAH